MENEIGMRHYLLYFILILSCFSCEKEASSHFIIAENECKETRLNGDQVKLCLENVQDSRCCIYCYCVWQGVATASFVLKANNQNIPFQLNTLDSPSPYRTDTTIMGYNIRLLKVTPYPGESSEPKKVEVFISRQ